PEGEERNAEQRNRQRRARSPTRQSSRNPRLVQKTRRTRGTRYGSPTRATDTGAQQQRPREQHRVALDVAAQRRVNHEREHTREQVEEAPGPQQALARRERPEEQQRHGDGRRERVDRERLEAAFFEQQRERHGDHGRRQRQCQQRAGRASRKRIGERYEPEQDGRDRARGR